MVRMLLNERLTRHRLIQSAILFWEMTMRFMSHLSLLAYTGNFQQQTIAVSISQCSDRLIPLATVVTPNQTEAECVSLHVSCTG